MLQKFQGQIYIYIYIYTTYIYKCQLFHDFWVYPVNVVSNPKTYFLGRSSSWDLREVCQLSSR